jgi:hypothetical protein
MFVPQRPDDQTDCINGVVSAQQKVRGEPKDGDGDEREKVVLCKSKVKCDFFAKVVFDRVEFLVCDAPLAGPGLNPFLLSIVASQSKEVNPRQFVVEGGI